MRSMSNCESNTVRAAPRRQLILRRVSNCDRETYTVPLTLIMVIAQWLHDVVHNENEHLGQELAQAMQTASKNQHTVQAMFEGAL